MGKRRATATPSGDEALDEGGCSSKRQELAVRCGEAAGMADAGRSSLEVQAVIDDTEEVLGDGPTWSLAGMVEPDVVVVPKPNFANLLPSLKDPIHCNIVLLYPGGTFYAHSIPLCTSEYLKTLLDPNSGFRTKWEDNRKAIDFPAWTDADSIEGTLEFLYSGAPGECFRKADGRRLYALAELMLMPDMQRWLEGCVDAKNWPAVWHFSKRGRTELQEACIRVVNDINNYDSLEVRHLAEEDAQDVLPRLDHGRLRALFALKWEAQNGKQMFTLLDAKDVPSLLLRDLEERVQDMTVEGARSILPHLSDRRLRALFALRWEAENGMPKFTLLEAGDLSRLQVCDWEERVMPLQHLSNEDLVTALLDKSECPYQPSATLPWMCKFKE